MNLLVTALVYLYLLYSENPSEVHSVLNSTHFSYFYDNKFFIGVYVAFLYFGFLVTYEKLLYVIAVALTALTVYLYVTDLAASEVEDIRKQLEQLRAQYDELVQTHTTAKDNAPEPPTNEHANDTCDNTSDNHEICTAKEVSEDVVEAAA